MNLDKYTERFKSIVSELSPPLTMHQIESLTNQVTELIEKAVAEVQVVRETPPGKQKAH